MIPDALADVLIPAAAGMPSATQAGATGPWLERVFDVRPDLAAEVARVLTTIADPDPREAVVRLERTSPRDLEVLLTALGAAYFMSDAVRERLGYTGQRALRPDTAADATLKADSELLRPVVERGAIYRAPPR